MRKKPLLAHKQEKDSDGFKGLILVSWTNIKVEILLVKSYKHTLNYNKNILYKLTPGKYKTSSKEKFGKISFIIPSFNTLYSQNWTTTIKSVQQEYISTKTKSV